METNSDHRWKYRRQGGLAVLLLLLGCTLAYGWFDAGRGIEITDAQRKILIRELFVPVEVVKTVEIVKNVRVPYEIEKLVTERVEVIVPGAPVEVVRTIEVSPECPDVVDVVELGGGCDVLFVGTAPDRMVQGWWRATVTGNGWEASRGPILSANVKAEVTKASSPSKWQRWWVAGPLKVDQEWGGLAGLQLQHTKLGSLSVQAGIVGVPTFSDNQSVSYSSSEPVMLVQYGRKF